MKKYLTNFLITIVFLTIGIFVSVNQVYAETEVSGNITSNTTWTLTDSPYVVASTVQVLEGARLTIEPGVEIKFNKSTGLNVDGELIANGTSDAIIKFTSNQSTPKAGDWLGILFSDNSKGAVLSSEGNYLSGSVVKYSIIEYGGAGTNGGVRVYPTNFILFLSDSIIRNNNEIGISWSGSNSKILNNTISNHSGYGLIVSSSNNEVSGNTLIGNSQVGITLSGHNNTLSNNIITGNSHDKALVLDGAYSNTISNNTTSNSLVGIQLNNSSHDNTITGNSIKNNLYSGIEIGGNSVNNQILRNTLESNGDGINFYKPTTIKYNNIKNNGIGIVAGGVDSDLSNNNIYNNTNYDFKVNTGGTVQNINTPNNWWGTTNKPSIANKIYDYYDDVSLGKVIYEPYALANLNFNNSDTFSTAPMVACISFTYSDWSTCQSDGIKTRTINSSSPNDCSGGNPVLTQSCTYIPTTCTSWIYSNWGACTNGQQARTIISSSTVNCGGGNPILNQSCTIQPSDCTSWTYSDWSACQSNGTKTRSVVSSSPSSCSNGNPVLTQSCTYIAPVCSSWTYSDWSICSNGQQTRNIISSLPTGCAGGISNITRSCTVDTPNNENEQEQTCSSFTYSNWSNCSKDNIQLRSALSGLPSNCSGGQPTLSQTCIYVADKIDTIQADVIKTNNEEKSAEVSVVVAEVINREQSLAVKKDTQLTNRLKGKILLQVESKGEAWYVSPGDGKKIYMANGNEAYQIMRNEGIGISNKDLGKINTDKNFAKKNNGKIFLQVEARGEAYYIDSNGVAHYLKDGIAAYEVMRSLGLGISNKDIRKIEVDN